MDLTPFYSTPIVVVFENSCVKKEGSLCSRVMAAQLTQECASRPSYANLPEVALLKIFSYLTAVERSRIARTCRSWNAISRSRIFWEKLNISDIIATQFLKLLPYLPQCVTHLNISCHTLDTRIALPFPSFMITLRKRCPSLRTFILERVFFPEDPQTTDTRVAEPFALERYPQELYMFSLRYSVIQSHLLSYALLSFIPHIKVLDFSHTLCITDDVVPFFACLKQLKELYLFRCPVTGNFVARFLKAAKHLRVLDLESTGLSDSAFSDLKTFGHSLEKLYLANTPIDDSFMWFDNQNVFRRLRIMCLRSTFVTHEGVDRLLRSCPSLRNVDVTQCDVGKLFVLEQYQSLRSRLTYDFSRRYVFCDHFKTNNFIP